MEERRVSVSSNELAHKLTEQTAGHKVHNNQQSLMIETSFDQMLQD